MGSAVAAAAASVSSGMLAVKGSFRRPEGVDPTIAGLRRGCGTRSASLGGRCSVGLRSTGSGARSLVLGAILLPLSVR